MTSVVRVVLSICLVIIGLACESSAWTYELQLKSVSDVVAYAQPAVVFIKHRDTTGQVCSGTGFLIRQDGDIITCAHVVQRKSKPGSHITDKIWVRLYDGTIHEAERLQCDSAIDIAILHIDVEEYPYLDIEPSIPNIGDDVTIIGFPLGEILGKEPSVSHGMVSAVRYSWGGYQLDAAVNPGNSGGPVLDKNGDILGVLSFKVRGAEGMCVAIASSLLPLKPSYDGRSGSRKDRLKERHLNDGTTSVAQPWSRSYHIEHNTRSPLHRAASAGDLKAARALIGDGADVNGRDVMGRTPLSFVALSDTKDKVDRLRKLNMATFLIGKGANINSKGETGTPLTESAFHGFTEFVRLLLDHGADVELTDNNGWKPLMVAAGCHSAGVETTACVRMLLEHGADVNAKDNSGETALHHAVMSEMPECVQLLIERGANVNAATADGVTPLGLAMTADKILSPLDKTGVRHKVLQRIIAILVDHGAVETSE